LLTDKTAATDGVTTFDLSLQEIKDIAGGVSNHNDLNNLNVGGYQHLTAAEKANFIATKVTTIGTGGEYATVGAAVIAGKKRLIFISDVTETANIAPVGGIYDIDLNGFTLSLGTYFFGGASVPVYNIENGTITGTNLNNSTCTFRLLRCIVTMTARYCGDSGSEVLNFFANFCSLNFANNSTAFHSNAARLGDLKIENSILNGSGVTCFISFESAVAAAQKSIIRDCKTTGTFNTIFLVNADNFSLASGSVTKIAAVMNITSLHNGLLNRLTFAASTLDLYAASGRTISIQDSVFSAIAMTATDVYRYYLNNIKFENSGGFSITKAGLAAGFIYTLGNTAINSTDAIISALRIVSSNKQRSRYKYNINRKNSIIMQINSKSTHEVITAEITYGILAKCFVNDLKHLEKSATFHDWQIDKNQTIEQGKTIAEFELEQAYAYLLTLPDFADFELSNAKNWKFETRPIRLIVDKKKLTPHLLANDAVGQLVSFVLNDAEIKMHTIDNSNEEFIYIYLNFLQPEHEIIILNSDCIIIDLI